MSECIRVGKNIIVKKGLRGVSYVCVYPHHYVTAHYETGPDIEVSFSVPDMSDEFIAKCQEVLEQQK